MRDADDPVNGRRDLVNDPQSKNHDPLNDLVNNKRQQWAIEQMRANGEFRKAEIVAQFKCSSKTAGRDLRDLRRRGLIEFVGPTKTGYWRLAH